MQLCRFNLPGTGARLGIRLNETVYDLTASDQRELSSLASLLEATATVSVHSLLGAVALSDLPTYQYDDLDRLPDSDQPHLLPPVDRQEVWAAGVTYSWSRDARVREAETKAVYVQVYEAERPELFFKSTPEKVIGPNNWIGLRGDSQWNVPEPELVLVLNPAMEIVGYTIGNDVSSRDIEGKNPLYLPQAKIYRHACAVGPVIALLNEVDGHNLAIGLTISRDGVPVFQGETSSAELHRRPQELVEYLARYNDFPYGALLFTGTGIVPDDDFTLEDGDDVSIEIEGIGSLRNSVRRM